MMSTVQQLALIKRRCNLQWLYSQIQQYKVLLLSLKNATLCNRTYHLQENRVCELKATFDDLARSSMVQECKIQSLQLHDTLMKLQFLENQDGLRSVKLLMDTLRTLLMAVKNILLESEGLQSSVQSLKRSNVDMAQQNHRRINQLQLNVEDSHECTANADNQVIELQKEYKMVANKLHLVENSLQAFILGIGVGWAEDSNLLDLVLSMDSIRINT